MSDWKNDRIASALRVCAAADPGFRRVNLEILGNTDTLRAAIILELARLPET